MDIYVVQIGDTLLSIANQFGVSINKLIQENGIKNPYNLVPGQTIVITYPSQTHTVKTGDTLASIADEYNITVMQLLKNNSFLANRTYIYPGETLIISYNTTGTIITHGFAYSYINQAILRMTLPELTYLSIFNYRVTEEGQIEAYNDDSTMIQLAKQYGVAPLLMISALTPTGELIPGIVDRIIFDEEFQDFLIKNAISTIKSSGYTGANILFSNLNEYNQKLYISFLTKVSDMFGNEGLTLFITVDPHIESVNNTVTFDLIDYQSISQLVDGLIFLQHIWSTNYNPPAPVSSIYLLRTFINEVVKTTPPDKIFIGKPLIGYDWELPFIQGESYAYSLTLDSVIALAADVGAIIQFDETSQTPFFTYTTSFVGSQIEHIVWFLDARSFNVLNDLVDDYRLAGSGVWNIMIYNQQLWTLTNSRYDIVKVLPNNIDR